MRIFREAAFALCLLMTPAVLVACDTFGAIKDPTSIGCEAAERDACRLVVAGHVLKSAAITVGEALDRRTITPTEANRLLGLVRKGRDALVQAQAVLPLANATTAERIAALEAILYQVLAEQLIKEGA